MTTITSIATYLHELLNVQNISDYCPNGLQVAGRERIKKIVTGVTACQDLLDAAVVEKADAIVVHHGFFWKGENPCLIGTKYNRLQTLLKNDISLFAYHLPLDLHIEYGNNIQLGKLLNMKNITQATAKNNLDLIFLGELAHQQSAHDFSNFINLKLNRMPLHIAKTNKLIKTIAWCTGAAANYIEDAIQLGVDAYLTGEISEHTVHTAREAGIHLFAAGHHATERYGVRALGEHLSQKFNLQHQFIDIDNPI